MRRKLKSTVAAFSVGLFWAGAGTLAMMGLHYGWAPPSPDAGAQSEHAKIASSETAASGLERWRLPLMPAARVEPAAAESKLRTDDKAASEAEFMALKRTADVEAQRALTRAIQQELARVGCYAGSVDGAWSEGTRGAMASFNRSVKVQLPTTAPDYILLTLLQGHPTTACGQSQQRGVTVAKVPANKATPAPDAAGSDVARADGPRDGWSTNVVIAPTARPALQPSPSPVVVAIPAPLRQQQVLSSTTSEPIGVPQLALAPPAVFQGRMTIGGPAPAAPAAVILPPEPQRAPGVAAAISPGAIAPPAVAPRKAVNTGNRAPTREAKYEAPAQRRSGSGSQESSSSRGQRMFTDMSRNSP